MRQGRAEAREAGGGSFAGEEIELAKCGRAGERVERVVGDGGRTKVEVAKFFQGAQFAEGGSGEGGAFEVEALEGDEGFQRGEAGVGQARAAKFGFDDERGERGEGGEFGVAEGFFGAASLKREAVTGAGGDGGDFNVEFFL